MALFYHDGRRATRRIFLGNFPRHWIFRGAATREENCDGTENFFCRARARRTFCFRKDLRNARCDGAGGGKKFLVALSHRAIMRALVRCGDLKARGSGCREQGSTMARQTL